MNTFYIWILLIMASMQAQLLATDVQSHWWDKPKEMVESAWQTTKEYGQKADELIQKPLHYGQKGLETAQSGLTKTQELYQTGKEKLTGYIDAYTDLFDNGLTTAASYKEAFNTYKKDATELIKKGAMTKDEYTHKVQSLFNSGKIDKNEYKDALKETAKL